jgi:maltooligosyltrehalose trehalohydrolase
LYFYRLNGSIERPDPASRSQPQGVHGPSQVVDPHFDWHDQNWFGLPLKDYVLYELHVGAFTPEGTLDAIIGRLDDLIDLGVTAIELMPLAQFPGGRNWGYDGVYPFAVQDSYGGPPALKHLVDACHQRGLAVVLDVVYNHLGPEGNYLADFGPYFTDRYKTPWGDALNFDGPYSDEVRDFFIQNARYWQTEFHIDALRLDAVHAIQDHSAYPFLEELNVATAAQAERLNRRFYLIAESNLNDTRLIRPRELGGYGLHSQWSDDFHHALHCLLTGERASYYADFGDLDQMAAAYRDGFAYTGQFSPFRERRHGNSPRNNHAEQFVVCIQNHDQVGNRMLGERLSTLVDFDGLKLAAAVVLLSPYVPLLFMGEEYGETASFQYFTSHGDPALIDAVRKGRREEFAAFRWQGEAPDPQAEDTFRRSRLQPELRRDGRHRVIFDWHRELLRLRKTIPSLALLSKECLQVREFEREKTLFVRRWCDGDAVWMVFHFGERPARLELPTPAGTWRQLLDSSDPRWLGQGTRLAESFHSDGVVELTIESRGMALYRREAAN